MGETWFPPRERAEGERRSCRPPAYDARGPRVAGTGGEQQDQVAVRELAGTTCFPAEDYTSGSVAGDPDFPGWPAGFTQVLFRSADGAPLYGQLALHSGKHPGVVVVHGFSTNGYDSVVRWAAMLYASGYNVLAADQRDFKYEYRDPNKYGYPNWLQTFGWKEAEDVVAVGLPRARTRCACRW